jgi:hypothetical protein
MDIALAALAAQVNNPMRSTIKEKRDIAPTAQVNNPKRKTMSYGALTNW